jgi:hypothetical protein
MIFCQSDYGVTMGIKKKSIVVLQFAFITGVYLVGPSIRMHNIHILKVLVVHLQFRDKESYAVITYIRKTNSFTLGCSRHRLTQGGYVYHEVVLLGGNGVAIQWMGLG